ncbi:MAG: hypothetical protein JWM25_1476 [Thermoleophilia bacterium]|nr:hypothetical protein [Thermoleophilia bacterium]MCZ4496891.1 hypothetical protein [Thermoleophilia bacterium]
MRIAFPTVTATAAPVMQPMARFPQPWLREAQSELYAAQRVANLAVAKPGTVTSADFAAGAAAARHAVDLLLGNEPLSGQDLAGAATFANEGADLLLKAAAQPSNVSFAAAASEQFSKAFHALTFGGAW